MFQAWELAENCILGSFEITTQPEETASSSKREQTLARACLCAKIAEELRGSDTLVLDMTGVTPIFDYFVITTGTNRRQVLAIANQLKVTLKGQASPPLGVEGDESGRWVLQDFGDIVVHIFSEDARGVYDLEHLWADAPRVDWQSQVGLSE